MIDYEALITRELADLDPATLHPRFIQCVRWIDHETGSIHLMHDQRDIAAFMADHPRFDHIRDGDMMVDLPKLKREWIAAYEVARILMWL